MKKWMISALIYLVVVVGSYYAYTSISGAPAEDIEHSNTEQHDQ
ncbi:hypothetical protein [Bacillus sp. V3B]|nr:hypothetical protein [Bacillus sp. V3B]